MVDTQILDKRKKHTIAQIRNMQAREMQTREEEFVYQEPNLLD